MSSTRRDPDSENSSLVDLSSQRFFQRRELRIEELEAGETSRGLNNFFSGLPIKDPPR